MSTRLILPEIATFAASIIKIKGAWKQTLPVSQKHGLKYTPSIAAEDSKVAQAVPANLKKPQ